MTTAKVDINIFTDAEWNLLYDALAEFQDHEESYDDVKDLMNKISSFFNTI
jgi:protein associated with RNAse G/E